MGPAGLLAILAGWFTTEVGQQPFVVYGVQRTADAVSVHDFGSVAVTLVAFVVVYFFVFGAGAAYVVRLVRKGPVTGEGGLPIEGGPGEKGVPHDLCQQRLNQGSKRCGLSVRPRMVWSMEMGIDLSLIWAVILFFGVMMYIVMDGFDLGIGILFPFAKDKQYRDVMMNTVAPVWDGNETWLVLGGAGLLAAFRWHTQWFSALSICRSS